MFWDLCLKYIQIYFSRKHVDLVKTALFGCRKFFCFIHTSQVSEWCGNHLRLKFNVWQFLFMYLLWKIFISAESSGFYHLDVDCGYEEVNYWLFSENNVFMQNISVKQQLLFFALRNMVTQECRQKVRDVNLRSQISLSGPFYR